MMKALKSSLPLLTIYDCLGWLCCCWWAILPFSMGLANVFLGISSLVSLMIISREKESIHPILLLPGSVLLMLCAISLLWSNDVLFGLRELKNLLPLMLSSLVTYTVVKSLPDYIRISLTALLFSCLLTFLATSLFNILPFDKAIILHQKFGDLLQPFHESHKGMFGWYVPFMVRTQYGNLLSMTGLASFLYGWIHRRFAYVLAGISFWLMVLVLGLRGSVLGIACMSVVLTSFFLMGKLPKKPNRWWWVAVILIASSAGILSLDNVKARWNQTKFEWEVIKRGEYQNYDYQHFTLLTRLVSWKNGFELWKRHPLLGTGIGDYKKEYALTYQDDPVEVPLYYHSQWLWFMGVFGCVGLLAFIWLYVKWLIKSIKYPISWIYGLCISAYCFTIWIFDAGMLSQTDMMSFGLFTTLLSWFSKDLI